MENYYSTIEIGKINISQVASLTNRYNHDKRIADCENADPERRHLNETLVKVPGMPGESKTYVQGVEERIQALPYYQDHKIRKNAVISYDVVLTFSKGADEALRMDIEEWKRRNVEFLRNTFNVAPDGRSNIISMEYHGDESTPHIHAVVVPIDERGRLNARRFTGGSRMMSDLQTSYAKEMSVFGLERGLEGSSARHVDIRKWYASVNKAMDVPVPTNGESAIDYYSRLREDISSYKAALHKREQKNRADFRRMQDEYKQNLNDAIKGEYDRVATACDARLAEMERQLTKDREERSRLRIDKTRLSVSINELRKQHDDLLLESEKNSQALELGRLILDKLPVLEKKYPSKATALRTLISELEAEDILFEDRDGNHLSKANLETQFGMVINDDAVNL